MHQTRKGPFRVEQLLQEMGVTLSQNLRKFFMTLSVRLL